LAGQYEDSGMRLGIREATKLTQSRHVIKNPNVGTFKQTGVTINGH